MNFFRAFLIAAFALSLSSGCKKPAEKGNLTVQLQGFVGNQALSFVNSIYSDSLGKDFYFRQLKFYISHINLVKEDNSLVEVSEVQFLDYSDAAWKSFTLKAPAGQYKGIEFYIGMDPAQNDTKPEDFAGSHPLGPKNGMYWEWLKHVFVNLEGVADTTGQNFAGGNSGLNYHVGRDTCYRKVTLSGALLSIVDGGNKTIHLNLDVLKIFYGPSGTLDMFLEPGTQSEDGDLNIAIKFADQFAKAFSYSE